MDNTKIMVDGLKAVMAGEKTFDDLIEEGKPEFSEMEIIDVSNSGSRRDLAIRILRLERQLNVREKP